MLSPDISLPPPGPSEPFFVPDPERLGLGSFYENVRASERNPGGVQDGMTLVVTEPLTQEGETAEQTWRRIADAHAEVADTREYHENPGPVDLQFFKDYWEKPVVDEHIAAPESERTDDGLVRHIFRVVAANESLIDHDTPTHLGLAAAHTGSGGRYWRPLWGWDNDFNGVGHQAAGDGRRLRNTVINQAVAIDRTGMEPNSMLRVIADRFHPPLFGHNLRRLAAVEGPQVYKEFLPYLVKNWVTWTSGRTQLGNMSPTDIGMSGNSFRMEDGTFLEGIGVTGTTPRAEMYREDVRMARQRADARGITDPEAREREFRSFYANIRGGAAGGNDFHGGLCADGVNLHSIETVGRIPVSINSLLAHDELLMSQIYGELMGDNMMAELMYNEAVTRIGSMRRFLLNHENKTYQDRYIDGHWAEPDANMAYMLYNGIAAEEEIPGIREALEYYVHDGGVVTTLNPSEHNWGGMADWPMTAWVVMRGVSRAGHGVRDERESEKSLRLATRAWDSHIKGDRVSFQTTGDLRERVSALDPSDVGQVNSTGEYDNIDNFPPRGLVHLGFLQSHPLAPNGGKIPHGFTIRHDVLADVA